MDRPDNDPDEVVPQSVETKLLKQYQLYLETVWRARIYVYNRGDPSRRSALKCVPLTSAKRSVGVRTAARQRAAPESWRCTRNSSINVPSPLKAVNLIMGSLGLFLRYAGFAMSCRTIPTRWRSFRRHFENG